MQKVRGRGFFRTLVPDLPLPLVVDTRFQVLFHSPLGVLFTFPSRYLFTIGRKGVFSLGTWSSQIPTGFLVSCGTQVPTHPFVAFAYRAITVSGRTFQNLRLATTQTKCGPYNPKRISSLGLGSSDFARHYVRNLWFNFFSSRY